MPPERFSPNWAGHQQVSLEPGDHYAGVHQQFKLTGRLLLDSTSSLILHNERLSHLRRSFPALTVLVDHPSLSLHAG
jgi:hypothetical protein